MSSTRPAHPISSSLSDLARRCAASTTFPAASGGSDVAVTGMTLSSGQVRPGDLYAALAGARVHGARFAAEAVAAGAVAVLTDAEGAGLLGEVPVPVLLVPDPRSVLGAVASQVYGDPASAISLMAVTGTQGKTTTTRLLESGLERAGVPAAVIGTVGTRIRGEEVPSALTTPEAPDLHALFAVMRERGTRACAMEVSSHALVMGRVDGVLFDAAAFLNLGRDHLDFHRDLEDYFAAKASLFTPARTRRGVTNVDDEFGRRLLDVAQVPMETVSPSGADADWRAVDVEVRPAGSRFTVITPDGVRIPAGVPLTGDFNVANALCAIALAAAAGSDPAALAAGIAASPGVPGRLERIDLGQDFLAVVDYAHKPDALVAVLAVLRSQTPRKLILVLGAGGDRDTGKRALMGAIGARDADLLIVTDDNPRSEDPGLIRAAILQGASGGAAEILEIGDRAAAIREALRLAQPGDTVLVAGKGHETGQEIAGVREPFDDRDQVRLVLGGGHR